MNRSSVDVVLGEVRKNKFRVWGGERPESALQRLRGTDFVRIHHTPKFKIDARDSIFTIGSCFARNVESILVDRGFHVLNHGFGVSKDLYYDHPELSASSSPIHAGVLNKYNVASMRTEIERSLGLTGPIRDEGLIEVAPGSWFDPQASGIRPNAYEIILDMRRKLLEVTAAVARAQVVFITLGLTETWYDAETGLALNVAPSPQLMKQNPGRYLFENATIGQVTDDLTSIIGTIRAHCGHPRIVLTVSPVPLGSTWTQMDVISANTYSKSTLRTAVGLIADANPDVDYFPSYEMAMFSRREVAWEADGIHVSGPMVRHIVETFSEIYCQ